MSPREHVEVDALASVLTIPVLPDVRHGGAVEQTCDGEGDAVCKRYPDKNVYLRPQLLAWEDSQAKEEKRHLRESKSHEVEYFSKPSELDCISSSG